jgi:hypothetical protein
MSIPVFFFRAFSRVVIPNEFHPDWARIGLEQLKTSNPQKRAKTHESFGFLSAAIRLIRADLRQFLCVPSPSGRVRSEQFERGFPRTAADGRGFE